MILSSYFLAHFSTDQKPEERKKLKKNQRIPAFVSISEIKF
jgi:hypothetical protein